MSADPLQVVSQCAITVTVRNVSEQPINWDREFESFLGITVTTDDGAKVAEQRDGASDEKRPDVSGRFFKLPANATYSRRIALADQTSCFVAGHGTVVMGEGYLHYPIGYETRRTFRIPPSASGVKVRVSYLPPYGADEFDGFKEWFGVSPDEIGLPRGYADSAVEVGFRMPGE